MPGKGKGGTGDWGQVGGAGGDEREVETPRGPLRATAGMLEGPIFLKAHLAHLGVARFLPLPIPLWAQSPPALFFRTRSAALATTFLTKLL